MRSLVELCIRRPVFTWVLVFGAVVLGLAGLQRMSVERYPNVDFAFVSVTVTAPGLSARQMESEIAVRVENALGTVSGLDRLDSISSEGMTLLLCQFLLSKNSLEAANEVRDRLSRLSDELPVTAKPPRIETFNMNSAPVMLLSLESPSGARTPVELTELADTVLRREMQSILGVGEVRLVGGQVRTLSIVLDPIRLASADLTASEVRDALTRESLEAPGGTLVEADVSLGLRLTAKARTREELESVVVAHRGELAVRISDVGHVEDAGLALDSRASVSGHPAMILAVTKQPGANTVNVADDIRDRLEAVRARLPDGVTARVLQDNSEDVRASVTAVAEHLILGAILAAAVVLIFLRSWRATLIAALAIPTSILATFAVAHALGVTLNLLSLLGLTLAVGIVIDDAIVVLENILRVMHARNLPARDATVVATKEIALAVLATTLSLVAVFLPVATMEGIVGRYLAPFGLTMSASILLSMGVAFTLTPMLCSRWLDKEAERERAKNLESTSHAPGRIERAYSRMLSWLLRKRWVAGIAIVLTIGSTVPIATLVPATFLPVEDMSRYGVYVRLPEGASIDRTAQVGEEISTALRSLPDVQETALQTLSTREAVVVVFLSRRGVQADRIVETRTRMNEMLAGRGLLSMVSPIDDFMPPGPDSAAIQFVMRGPDLEEIQGIANQLLEAAQQIPGTVDHGLTTAGGKAELSIQVDRAQASQLGVSHAEIGRALELADRRGVDLGTVSDPRSTLEVSVPLRLRVGSELLGNEELVRALPLRGESGELLALSDLATIERSLGPGLIRRANRQRQITLFMNVLPGTSDAEVVASLEAKLREIDPAGRIHADMIGNAKEMAKAFVAFLLAIVLSFAFMYLVLAAQFESWIHPVTILMSLPLTIPFGLLALLLGGQSLNLFSALGFLVLFGVVKKNSILQIDRTIQLRDAGHPRDQAVLEACTERLRPILMTTIAFVAGMLPLVVSSGPGAATNRAIGVGVMGGQTLSLLLTLLATPILYTFFDDAQAWWRRKRGRGIRVSAPLRTAHGGDRSG